MHRKYEQIQNTCFWHISHNDRISYNIKEKCNIEDFNCLVFVWLSVFQFFCMPLSVFVNYFAPMNTEQFFFVLSKKPLWAVKCHAPAHTSLIVVIFYRIYILRRKKMVWFFIDSHNLVTSLVFSSNPFFMVFLKFRIIHKILIYVLKAHKHPLYQQDRPAPKASRKHFSNWWLIPVLIWTC